MSICLGAWLQTFLPSMIKLVYWYFPQQQIQAETLRVGSFILRTGAVEPSKIISKGICKHPHWLLLEDVRLLSRVNALQDSLVYLCRWSGHAFQNWYQCSPDLTLFCRWEGIPDMHVARKECSGFIMDSCFWVIGGIDARREALTSGERYDPNTQSWTLIENQWPGFATRPQPHPAPPLVAVVYDQLYALDAYHNQLKAYDKLTNEWSTLDVVPHRAEDSTGWGLGFKAVGGELWVIGGKDPVTGGPLARIDACIMDPVTRVFRWRRVASTWGSGFCFNCTVMKLPCELLAEGLDIVDMEQWYSKREEAHKHAHQENWTPHFNLRSSLRKMRQLGKEPRACSGNLYHLWSCFTVATTHFINHVLKYATFISVHGIQPLLFVGVL